MRFDGLVAMIEAVDEAGGFGKEREHHRERPRQRRGLQDREEQLSASVSCGLGGNGLAGLEGAFELFAVKFAADEDETAFVLFAVLPRRAGDRPR